MFQGDSRIWLIVIVIFAAWLGAIKLFGRRGSQSGGCVAEALAFLVVFVLTLTAFAGHRFWEALAAGDSRARAIMGIGAVGIVVASWLVSFIKDEAKKER